jgi:hypothetical protein
MVYSRNFEASTVDYSGKSAHYALDITRGRRPGCKHRNFKVRVTAKNLVEVVFCVRTLISELGVPSRICPVKPPITDLHP